MTSMPQRGSGVLWSTDRLPCTSMFLARTGHALGQRLRHFANHVTTTAGTTNGKRVRCWCQDKKVGGSAVLAEPQMPGTRTLLDQAHNTIERQCFAMKGLHH